MLLARDMSAIRSCCMQVLTQPWFAFVENTVQAKFGSSHAIHKEFVVSYQGTEMARLTMFRLIWRTLYVCFTTREPLILFDPVMTVSVTFTVLSKCMYCKFWSS